LFSIGTISVPKLAKSKQPITPSSSTTLGLIEQVLNVLVEPIFVLPIHILILHDIFKHHLLETFIQPEIVEIIIDETHAHEQIQNLCIASWTITQEEHLTKINLGTKKNLQQIKINIDLELVINVQLIELLKEFKDTFS
jgi:hypothetical protein